MVQMDFLYVFQVYNIFQWHSRYTNGTTNWAIVFNTIYAGLITLSPSYPSRDFCGFSNSYSNTQLTGQAGYGGPGVTYINAYPVGFGIGY